ncbi:hypothetical protein E8E15_000369 [Penicillium rubens]|nr:hypothetical protein E8E15_000369 [Penicillium rubens]
MARPASKGGMLIALLQPHSTQDNSRGFLEGIRDCGTLEAVSDLITTVNNAKAGFDDISVFDAIPLIDEAATGADISSIIANAHDVFADMARAKNPEIIICCFRTESHNTLVRKLRGCGVGRSFNDDKLAPKSVETGLSLKRVNAFHPSHAIHHYPIFCSLRRLLILEFTKAFGLLRHKWIAEPWMASLRAECSRTTIDLDDAKDEQGNWSELYIEARWEKLLASLEINFEKVFFGGYGNDRLDETYINLANSSITWLCCDIAWILEELDSGGYGRLELTLAQRLLQAFKSWCQKAWPEAGLQHNLTGSGGHYIHAQILLLTSNQPCSLSKRLENKIFTLLRDLNLSYESSGTIFPNKVAQGCAFRRFAAAFEDSLEEFLDNKLCQKNPGIRHQFDALSLN